MDIVLKVTRRLLGLTDGRLLTLDGNGGGSSGGGGGYGYGGDGYGGDGYSGG